MTNYTTRECQRYLLDETGLVLDIALHGQPPDEILEGSLDGVAVLYERAPRMLRDIPIPSHLQNNDWNLHGRTEILRTLQDDDAALLAVAERVQEFVELLKEERRAELLPTVRNIMEQWQRLRRRLSHVLLGSASDNLIEDIRAVLVQTGHIDAP